MVSTFTINSSVEILDSYFDQRDAHFRLRFSLVASTLALVLDEHLLLRFKFGEFRFAFGL